jgi:hypothetical protein
MSEPQLTPSAASTRARQRLGSLRVVALGLQHPRPRGGCATCEPRASVEGEVTGGSASVLLVRGKKPCPTCSLMVSAWVSVRYPAIYLGEYRHVGLRAHEALFRRANRSLP